MAFFSEMLCLFVSGVNLGLENRRIFDLAVVKTIRGAGNSLWKAVEADTVIVQRPMLKVIRVAFSFWPSIASRPRS